MSAALYVTAGTELAKLISSSIELHKQGVLSEQQLNNIWSEVGVNVANAEKLWQQAGKS